MTAGELIGAGDVEEVTKPRKASKKGSWKRNARSNVKRESSDLCKHNKTE